VDPPTDVFTFFRNLNVFVRNKKRFELKVVAVLLNAFGLSLRKTSSFFGLLSEPVSKSSVEEWTRKVEEKLSFNPKPREYPVIAVDESVVKCRGPTAVGVGWCRRCNEATHLVRCFTHKDHTERPQVSS